MKIQKIANKVELNVSAQGCYNDCSYYVYNTLFHRLSGNTGCTLVVDSRWTTSH